MAKRGGYPGGMSGNMGNLMKQAQRMQRQMEESQKELETKEFTAKAGGGAVEVTVTGKKEVVKVPEEENVKETKKEIPNVKFDVATLSREKLSQEYVAGLMERIANLEDSGKNVDREELLMLNAELDAILEILRQ
jgi:hypothetical protein